MHAPITSYKRKAKDPIKEGLAASGNLYQMAFCNSLQANIIFAVADGRIISVNKSVCRLLGYSKKELLTKNRMDIFCISDDSYKEMLRQRREQGHTKGDVSIIAKGGRLLPCQISSVIFQNECGIDYSIMSIVDLRERMSKQKHIDVEYQKIVDGNIVIAQSKSDCLQADNNNWIRSIANVSYDVIWDWDIATHLISFGSNYEKVFGIKLPENPITFKEWLNLFKPEERQQLEGKINTIFESGKRNWEATYPFTCPDGTIGQVISHANVIRNDDGKAIRMIGVIHDMSKMYKLEGILGQEIMIRKRQIIDAITEAKEMERSDIGKELHDNINQLLAASMLYLDMARKDLKNGEIYLIHSSEYTLSAIEAIRKLTKGLTTGAIADFGLCGAIEEICHDTMETYPVKITYKLDHSLEESLSEKFKLNVFRILQEQMNNIRKHAKASLIHIVLSSIRGVVAISIADNGVGFNPSKKSEGIGIKNIISRAGLYKGVAHFISEPGKGCTLMVSFPVLSAG
ncbi:MAG TPA: PAS domain S-box protein [Puia sp.]|nr:PAS domain S-box protein [Puia sp.]